MTRRTPDPRLVPIVKTAIYRSFRTGKPECWGAKTVDGQWAFERSEETGTPWLVTHQASVDDKSLTGPVLVCHTLRDCRIGVGSGYAAAVLAKMKCKHPADQRSSHVERGTFDYTYVDCKACGASRAEHDDDDGCRTCLDGREHEWFAHYPAQAA